MGVQTSGASLPFTIAQLAGLPSTNPGAVLDDNWEWCQNAIPLSATNFGAVGDGVTDDTSALSAWATALSSAGGVGYLPPGTFLTTTGVSFTTNAVQIELAAGATLKSTSSAPAAMVTLNVAGSLLTGAGTIDCGSQTTTGVVLTASARVEKVTIQNADAGNGLGFGVNIEASNCVVDGVSFANIGNTAVLADPTNAGPNLDNVTVRNCSIDRSAVSVAAAINPSINISQSGNATYTVTEAKVIGNRVKGPTGSNSGIGIQIYGNNAGTGTPDAVVSNNIVENHWYAVSCSGVNGVVVIGNSLYNYGRIGCELSNATNGGVVGNLFDGASNANGNAGVVFDGSSDFHASVVGNTFQNHTGFGTNAAVLYFSGVGTGSNVGDNLFDLTANSNTWGIDTGGVEGLSFSGNVFRGGVVAYGIDAITTANYGNISITGGAADGQSVSIVRFRANSTETFQQIRISGLAGTNITAWYTTVDFTAGQGITFKGCPGMSTGNYDYDIVQLKGTAATDVIQAVGSGAPSFAAGSGSICQRTDGSTGNRFYVAAGSATWDAVSGV